MKAFTFILSIGILFLVSCNAPQTEVVEVEPKVEEVTPVKPVINAKSIQYIELDFSGLNVQAKSKSYGSAEEILAAYYNFPVGESEGGKPEFNTISLSDGSQQVIMIHDKLMDDSMRGIRLEMIAIEDNGMWTVQSLRKTWKCWEGRGHEGWGTAPCS